MNNEYSLDLNSIINSHESWALNKQLATKLSLVPHSTVESFFKSLSHDDLIFLGNGVNNSHHDDHAAAELFLMTLLLMVGEGLSIDSDEELEQNYNTLITFITLESLSRSGLVELKRENMSFGADMAGADLVKATDAGVNLIAQLLNDKE
jgi:hypothetical protein